jgi:hypothetical protein
MLFSISERLQEADFRPLPKSQLREKETRCIICLEEYSDRENPAILLPCHLKCVSSTDSKSADWRHIFCVSCINTWLEGSTLCPTCRTPLLDAPLDDEDDSFRGSDDKDFEDFDGAAFLEELAAIVLRGNTGTGDFIDLNLDGVNLDQAETWVTPVVAPNWPGDEEVRRMNAVLMANHSEEEKEEFQRWVRQHLADLEEWLLGADATRK